MATDIIVQFLANFHLETSPGLSVLRLHLISEIILVSISNILFLGELAEASLPPVPIQLQSAFVTLGHSGELLFHCLLEESKLCPKVDYLRWKNHADPNFIVVVQTEGNYISTRP